MKKEQMDEFVMYSENICELIRKMDKTYNKALKESNNKKKPTDYEEKIKKNRENIVLEQIRKALSDLVYAESNILTAKYLNEEEEE